VSCRAGSAYRSAAYTFPTSPPRSSAEESSPRSRGPRSGAGCPRTRSDRGSSGHGSFPATHTSRSRPLAYSIPLLCGQSRGTLSTGLSASISHMNRSYAGPERSGGRTNVPIGRIIQRTGHEVFPHPAQPHPFTGRHVQCRAGRFPPGGRAPDTHGRSRPQAVVATVVAVLFRDEAGEPLHDELVEVVEHGGRVAKGKVTTPSPEQQVEAFHDALDVRRQQPAGSLCPDALLGPPYCTLRGPTGAEVPALAGEALSTRRW